MQGKGEKNCNPFSERENWALLQEGAPSPRREDAGEFDKTKFDHRKKKGEMLVLKVLTEAQEKKTEHLRRGFSVKEHARK